MARANRLAQGTSCATRKPYPSQSGATHVIFESLDFISRLVVLVPRPRVHLTRFHGLFAPNSGFGSISGSITLGSRCSGDERKAEFIGHLIYSVFSSQCDQERTSLDLSTKERNIPISHSSELIQIEILKHPTPHVVQASNLFCCYQQPFAIRTEFGTTAVLAKGI
jgi:hypothetical protein